MPGENHVTDFPLRATHINSYYGNLPKTEPVMDVNFLNSEGNGSFQQRQIFIPVIRYVIPQEPKKNKRSKRSKRGEKGNDNIGRSTGAEDAQAVRLISLEPVPVAYDVSGLRKPVPVAALSRFDNQASTCKPLTPSSQCSQSNSGYLGVTSALNFDDQQRWNPQIASARSFTPQPTRPVCMDLQIPVSQNESQPWKNNPLASRRCLTPIPTTSRYYMDPCLTTPLREGYAWGDSAKASDYVSTPASAVPRSWQTSTPATYVIHHTRISEGELLSPQLRGNPLMPSERPLTPRCPTPIPTTSEDAAPRPTTPQRWGYAWGSSAKASDYVSTPATHVVRQIREPLRENLLTASERPRTPLPVRPLRMGPWFSESKNESQLQGNNLLASGRCSTPISTTSGHAAPRPTTPRQGYAWGGHTTAQDHCSMPETAVLSPERPVSLKPDYSDSKISRLALVPESSPVPATNAPSDLAGKQPQQLHEEHCLKTVKKGKSGNRKSLYPGKRHRLIGDPGLVPKLDPKGNKVKGNPATPGSSPRLASNLSPVAPPKQHQRGHHSRSRAFRLQDNDQTGRPEFVEINPPADRELFCGPGYTLGKGQVSASAVRQIWSDRLLEVQASALKQTVAQMSDEKNSLQSGEQSSVACRHGSANGLVGGSALSIPVMGLPPTFC